MFNTLSGSSDSSPVPSILGCLVRTPHADYSGGVSRPSESLAKCASPTVHEDRSADALLLWVLGTFGVTLQ